MPNEVPADVTVNVLNSTIAEVTWTPLAEDDLNGVVVYEVLVERTPGQPRADPDAPASFTLITAHANASVVFDSLEEGIQYTAKVLAKTNVDTAFAESATAFSAPEIFNTKPAAPDVPPDVNSTAVDVTSFSFTWIEPDPDTHNSDLEFYHIRVRRAETTAFSDGTAIDNADFDGTNEWSMFQVTADVFELLVEELDDLAPLHPSLEYEFQIRAVGEEVMGTPLVSPWSPPTTVRLLDAVPSGNVTQLAFSTEPNALSLQWRLPEPLDRNGLVTGFSVVYSREDDDVRVVVDSLSGCPLSLCTANVTASGDVLYAWPLDNLEAFVTYTVEVRALTAAGEGPATVRVIRTDEDIPSAAVVLGTEESTSDSIDVDFDPLSPPDRNGYAQYRASIAIDEDDAFFSDRINTALQADLPGKQVVFSDQDNTTMTYSVSGLQAYMKYNLEVVPFTGAGDGEASTTTIITDEAQPAAPEIALQLLTDATSETKTVRVAVTLPDKFERNGVLQRVTIDYETTEEPSDDGSQTTLIEEAERQAGELTRDIAGLEAGVTYRFTASITNRAVAPETSVSPASSAESLRTDEYIPTSGVRNFAASEITDEEDAVKEVGLLWNAPTLRTRNGELTGYALEVFVTPNGATAEEATPVIDRVLTAGDVGGDLEPTNPMSFTVTGLNAYDNYRFKLTPETAIGRGTVAKSVRADPTVNGGILSPALPAGAVQGLQLSATETSVSATWTALDVADWNDAALEYRVVLARLESEFSASGAEVLETTTIAGTSITFDGLEEYVDYEVTVTPINTVFTAFEDRGDDLSALGAQAQKRTEAAVPADSPTIDDTSISMTAHTITLSWSVLPKPDFNGPPRRYVVQYRGLAFDYVENGNTAATADEIPTAADHVTIADAGVPPTYTLTDLDPNRVYEIAVAAENAEVGVSGPFSSTVTVQTWSFRPQPPLPTVTFYDDRPNGESKATTLRISWPAINTRFGPVRRVQVVVEPEGSARFGDSQYNCTHTPTDTCGFGEWQTNEDARELKHTPVSYITYQRDIDAGADAGASAGGLVVGDERTYGGFFNGPLQSGGTYTVRVRAFTLAGDGQTYFDAIGPLVRSSSEDSLSGTSP